MHSASLVTTGLGPSRSSPGRLVGKWQAGASDRRWPSELQPSSPGIRSGRTSRPWSSPWTAASPRGAGISDDMPSPPASSSGR